MKHYIYMGLLVAGLGLGAMTAHAAEGIKDSTECLVGVDGENELAKIFSNLSTEQLPASQYFDQASSRFILCMNGTVSLTKTTTLINNSQYPVIIYGLKVDSSTFTPTDTTPMLTISGTGEIILQNLQALGLKAGIQSDGKATLLNASLSCDATLSGAAVILNSNYNRIEKSSITNCRQGVKVAGNRTLLDDVLIQKTVPAPAEGEVPQVGVVGVYVSGMGNALQGITVTGYRTGVRLSGAANLLDATADHKKTQLTGYTAPDGKVYPGSYGVYIGAEGNWVKHSVIDQFERGVVALANDIKVESNTLGGDLGAVVIGHNGETDKPYSPVTVSKNNFTTKETIIYVENSDKLAMRLLGVEWMGKHKSASDETKADLIVGKLLDQGNESTEVELASSDDANYEIDHELTFNRNCEIVTVDKDIPITLSGENNANETKKIVSGEKIFKCFFDAAKGEKELSLLQFVRFHSNTPTVSAMSDGIQLAKLGDLEVTVLAALPGSQMDTTDLGTNQPGATGAVMLASTDTGSLDSGGDVGGGGGGGSSTPTDLIVHDTGDNSGNSANNMTGNAATLGDGGLVTAGGGVAGAGAASSGGGCSLSTDATLPHSMTSALLWLLILMPVPVLVRVRVR